MKNTFFILSALFIMVGFASSAYAEKAGTNLKPAQNLQLFKDTDGDGVPDFRDNDADGNGIADKYKFETLSLFDLLSEMNLADFLAMTEEELREAMEDYLDGLDDEDYDDLWDELDEWDSEENKVGAFQYNPTILGGVDTDGDGIGDAVDRDDDNDGIPDDEDKDDDGDGILDIVERLLEMVQQLLKRHNM